MGDPDERADRIANLACRSAFGAMSAFLAWQGIGILCLAPTPGDGWGAFFALLASAASGREAAACGRPGNP
jgi:hypothetical protein